MPNCASPLPEISPNLIRKLQGKYHCPRLLVGILLLANAKSFSNEVEQKKGTSLERHWNASQNPKSVSATFIASL